MQCVQSCVWWQIFVAFEHLTKYWIAIEFWEDCVVINRDDGVCFSSQTLPPAQPLLPLRLSLSHTQQQSASRFVPLHKHSHSKGGTKPFTPFYLLSPSVLICPSSDLARKGYPASLSSLLPLLHPIFQPPNFTHVTYTHIQNWTFPVNSCT